MPLSFFKATYFETEEEALQHKKETGSNTNPHFSEKLSKYYLVEPNKLTSVIEKSIKDTVDFLKLKVDLGFEFEVGKNWSTHWPHTLISMLIGMFSFLREVVIIYSS